MIEVKNLDGFTYALKALKNGGIESVIFSNSAGKMAVNVKQADGTQIVNMKWNSEIVSIPKEQEKFGIYKLSEFLTTLEMFGSKDGVKCDIEDNKMSINYVANPKVEVKYNLSDMALIAEGPEGPKSKVEFLISLKLDKDFLKKIKTIASSLSVKVLKFEGKDGVVSYIVSDKHFHSHMVKEELLKSGVEDFSVCLNIDKLNIIPEGEELIINIHEKMFEFNVQDPNMELLRYYIAPTVVSE